MTTDGLRSGERQPSARTWRSSKVRLVLLGSAGTALVTGLGGCSAEFQRNIYGSLEDCAADYTSAICGTGGSIVNGQFTGPVYRMRAGRPSPCSKDDPGPGRSASKRIGVVPVQRGGFGTTCNRSGRSSYGLSSGRGWRIGG